MTHAIRLTRGPGHDAPRQPDWRDDASCYRDGIDTDLFFPEPGVPASLKVKALCQACPVRQQCLEFAVENQEMGVWGGLTEMERRPLVRAKIKKDGGRRRNCDHCGGEFIAKRGQMYCTTAHRQDAYEGRTGRRRAA